MNDNKTVFASGWNKVTNSVLAPRLKPTNLLPKTKEAYRILRCELYDGGCNTLDYATWKSIHNEQPVQLKLF